MRTDAIEAFRRGEMVLLYDFDNRERETDFAIRSDMVTPQDILRMRRDGGGLICTAIHGQAAENFGLPFAADVLRPTHLAEEFGEIPYDRRNHSSFSLWVNHRDTFTGITDIDRALTVGRIAEQVHATLAGRPHTFHEEFRTPGHMALLRAAENLLDQRRGQTELSVALALMAGVTPAVTICEMLDDTTGFALSKDDAKRYARRHGLVFVEGEEVCGMWDAFRETQASPAATGETVAEQ
ncbi:3,4-dihydroxy-2-butanone 4-phosphate synthase [Methanomicrobiaceae archaeon CYW5]|uniref:3,4-dihydroxy-2-butanone-4-phosphate synthase n=1 Tax=Methanovulcanius yangii TaxID=1789227 RepID=UPI0029CA2BDD|nr:3,4-dihydroxy-2-butanone-4-phosphate synthase [Methanovulcanius yangii]MBT8508894.1 3,4-dihydroxy-2-butanone 4-phosphate synthase [Methanovulcanius yangii]